MENNKKIFGICIGIVVLSVLAISVFNISLSNLLLFGMFLACPLIHLWMMKDESHKH